MTRLRIALDARDLAAPAHRGMTRYLVNLVSRLPALGCEVLLFHREQEPLSGTHTSGLPAAVVGLKDRGGIWWEQVSVPAALAKWGVAVYHAPAERGVPLNSPCPVALTIHSATHASYRRLVRTGQLPGPVQRYIGTSRLGARGLVYHLLHRFATRFRVDHYFTVSEFSRGELVGLLRLPRGKITVTPLAPAAEFVTAPTDRHAAVSRFNLPLPYLLCVGGYEPHKNPEGFLDCLAAVRSKGVAVNGVYVGTGPPPGEVRAAAERLGLREGTDVVFLSDLGPELVGVYDAAAAFVSLSWRESFGLPYVEALARGVPVVASAWGAAGEVTGGRAALVDPRDVSAAAAAVVRRLNQPRQPGETPLTWDTTAERTAAVYRRLAKGEPA